MSEVPNLNDMNMSILRLNEFNVFKLIEYCETDFHRPEKSFLLLKIKSIMPGKRHVF